MFLDPDLEHIVKLVVADGLEYGDQDDGDQRTDNAKVCAGKTFAGLAAPIHFCRQISIAAEVGCKPGEHKDRGHAKAIMPTVILG